ncbi:MAG: DUF748 domain-containing protein [Pedobacter sp.]
MINRLAVFTPKQKQNMRRIALWTAGFIALWAVAAGLVLPPIIRHVTEQQLSAKLGSTCTLEKVRFNPFTLRLTAENLRIPLPDGEECFNLERFEVRVSPAGIYRLAPVLSDLKLTSPHLEMRLRKDGTLSLADLAPVPQEASPDGTQQPQPDKSATEEQEWNLFGVMLTDLEISGGLLHFRDDIRETEHTVAELEFYAPFTSTLKRHRERSITPYLKAVINDRLLRVDGRLAPFAEQLHTEFDIRLDNLDLVRFQPYVQPFTSATLNNGQLKTNLVFSMRQQPETGIRLGLGGQLTLTELEVLAPNGDQALRLPRLTVGLEGSLNTPEGLTLKKVDMQGLEAHLARLEDGRIDWQTWLKKTTAKQEPAQAANQQPHLPLHLKLFTLREARVLWRDRTVKSGFQARAEQIALTLTDLDLPGTEPAELKASLTLNDAGHLSLEGKLLASPLQGNILLRLDDLPIADFQPYMADSGIPVTLQKGVFSGAGRLDIAENQEELAIFFKQGEAHLQELSLLRNDTGKVFFQMGNLALAGLTVDVPAHRLEVRQLLLDQPNLRLRRDRKGTIDLLQLRPSAAARSTGTDAPKPGKPWQTQLAELKLANGQVSVRLEGPRETSNATFQNLSGSVTGYDSAVNPPLNIDLSGQEKQGGTLRIDGKGTLTPLAMNLSVRTTRLNLKPFSPLLGQVNPALRLGAGTLTLALQTDLKDTAKNRLRIRGQASLESLSVLDGKQEFAAIRTLRIRDLDINTARQRYSAGKVTLTRPNINLIVSNDGTNNLARLLGKQPTTTTKPPAARSQTVKKNKTASTPYLRIGGVEIINGTMVMRDRRYKPAVTNRLEKLKVTVGELRNTPERQSRIVFSGELNDAPIKGEGTMNPLHADVAAELQASLKTLDLTRISPISERFIAYPLEQGSFSLDSRISIDRGKLDSTHKIRLDSLELGDKIKSPDAPNLPVKLGVSLLQDTAGNINLTLPVRGDLDDPSFSVGGLVFKVIANLLIKAVASPFMFLGGIMGSGEQGLEYIAFDPGEGRLPDQDLKTVETVADMLMSRPKINLVLIPQADEEDRAMLADAYALRRMQEIKHADLPRQERDRIKPQELQISPEVDADEYADLLFDVYAEQPFDKPKNFIGMIRKLPPQEMMEAIRQHYPKDDNALEQLALERARHLREAFIAVQPELESRISVEAPKVPGEGHRVTFGIK